MLVNDLYRKILKRELNLGENSTDFDILLNAFKNGYDIKELRGIIENNKFSEKELVLLSANSLEFFEKYLFPSYKATANFMLNVFKETSIYPENYFELISPELKINKEFLLKAIKYDGFVILDDEVIGSQLAKDRDIIKEAEKYFSKKNLLNLVIDIEASYEDVCQEIKELTLESEYDKSENQICNRDYNNAFNDLYKEKSKLANQLKFLKNLNAYKIQSQLKTD